MPDYDKPSLLFSLRLMTVLVPFSQKFLQKQKVPQHPKNPLCPLQKRAKQYLVIPQLDVNQQKLPQQRTDVQKRRVERSKKDLQKLKQVF